jgi:hypothetical protein
MLESPRDQDIVPTDEVVDVPVVLPFRINLVPQLGPVMR